MNGVQVTDEWPSGERIGQPSKMHAREKKPEQQQQQQHLIQLALRQFANTGRGHSYRSR